MNFALCYPTAPKDKEEQMSDGQYKPYFHGELVTEYKKSVANNKARKLSANGVEAQNHIEQVEEYVEPGIAHSRFFTTRHDMQPIHVIIDSQTNIVISIAFNWPTQCVSCAGNPASVYTLY